MKRLVCCLLLAAAVVIGGGRCRANNNEVGVRVIVIDAGHGGKAFPGATYGGVKEKDINLAVALKLGALIEKELPQIKVVYTRKTDTALGKTLNEDLTARANIANKAGGDFFISIHANAVPGKPSVAGAETIIMGESEKETRYNEDALYNNNKDELIDMSDENTAAMVRAYIQNLQFTYGEYSEMMARIMQSHYAKGGRNARRVNRQLLKVLYATDMPSVLTELGFMTNPKELAYMNSEKGQNQYARILCDAVKEYVGYIDKLTDAATAAQAGGEAVMRGQSAAESLNAATKATDRTSAAEAEKEQSVKSGESERKAETATQAVNSTEKPAAKSGTKSAAAAEKNSSRSGYAIQIMASDKRISSDDRQFGAYRGKVECYEGAGALKYKYCYGEFSTRAEAQRNLSAVRRTFRDAFVVRYENGRIAK